MPDAAPLEPGVLVLLKAPGDASTLLAPPECYRACGSLTIPIERSGVSVTFCLLAADYLSLQ